MSDHGGPGVSPRTAKERAQAASMMSSVATACAPTDVLGRRFHQFVGGKNLSALVEYQRRQTDQRQRHGGGVRAPTGGAWTLARCV
jgi:hypothetical protein